MAIKNRMRLSEATEDKLIEEIRGWARPLVKPDDLDPLLDRIGNYVPTVLPHRYDAFLYIDETRALRPLHLRAREEHELPETFPSGV